MPPNDQKIDQPTLGREKLGNASKPDDLSTNLSHKLYKACKNNKLDT